MAAQNSVTVEGKITFKGGQPETVSKPSQLIVKFSDTSYCDAPSKTLGKQKIDIDDNKYNKDYVLKYSITVPRPTNGVDFSLGAVINNGWIATDGGDEWIRVGDYLNDTMHGVDLQEGKTHYTKDIEVIHYKH